MGAVTSTLVLAHGSGVDDLLGLAVPVLIVGGLWLWSRRRSRPPAGEGDGAPGPE